MVVDCLKHRHLVLEEDVHILVVQPGGAKQVAIDLRVMAENVMQVWSCHSLKALKAAIWS